jgi:hypothetical protein
MKRSLLTLAAVLFMGLAVAGCTKTREEYQEQQKREPPALLCEKDGVRVYRVRDVETGLWVYFTTPSGDVRWTVPGDDDTPAKHFNVNGGKK